MDYETEILYIAGEEYAESWVKLRPKIYYKNNEPYGLIGTVMSDSITYIASTAKNVDDDFTIGMIRDIIRMWKKGRICLITDIESKQDLIRRSLDRYKFEYKIVNSKLYSIGG